MFLLQKYFSVTGFYSELFSSCHHTACPPTSLLSIVSWMNRKIIRNPIPPLFQLHFNLSRFFEYIVISMFRIIYLSFNFHKDDVHQLNEINVIFVIKNNSEMNCKPIAHSKPYRILQLKFLKHSITISYLHILRDDYFSIILLDNYLQGISQNNCDLGLVWAVVRATDKTLYTNYSRRYQEKPRNIPRDKRKQGRKTLN